MSVMIYLHGEQECLGTYGIPVSGCTYLLSRLSTTSLLADVPELMSRLLLTVRDNVFTQYQVLVPKVGTDKAAIELCPDYESRWSRFWPRTSACVLSQCLSQAIREGFLQISASLQPRCSRPSAGQ